MLFTRVFQYVNVEAGSSVIRVPQDYPSIQLAINAASPGDTIFVVSGVYEGNLTVNKSLTILGEYRDNTVIEMGGYGFCVTADQVTIDGFKIQGQGACIALISSSQSIISNNVIGSNVGYGIYLMNSYNNSIVDNLITKVTLFPPGFAGDAMCLLNSSDNIIKGNVMEDCSCDMMIGASNHNAISWNNFGHASMATLYCGYSNSSIIHHNRFAESGLRLYNSYNTTWDDGYAGNYWDNYAGLDDGSDGRIAGDGVGDTDLPENYPLVRPPQPIPVVINDTIYPVSFLSNSTIYGFSFDESGKTISFSTVGPFNTTGFWIITFPKDFMIGNPWQIKLNGHDITSNVTIGMNKTCMALYFVYAHGNHTSNYINIKGTQILPEYSIASLIMLVLVATPAMIIMLRHFQSRRKSKSSYPPKKRVYSGSIFVL